MKITYVYSYNNRPATQYIGDNKLFCDIQPYNDGEQYRCRFIGFNVGSYWVYGDTRKSAFARQLRENFKNIKLSSEEAEFIASVSKSVGF